MRQFSLETMFGVMAFVGCALAIGQLHAGSGILVAVLGTPSYLRAAYLLEARRRHNLPITVTRALGEFVLSMLLILACTFVALAAFCVVSAPIGAMSIFVDRRPNPGVFVALGFGSMVACVTGFFALRWWWPWRFPTDAR